MQSRSSSSGDSRAQLRRDAIRRRQAVLNRIASTRQAIVGGAAAATIGLVLLIDVLTPGHASASGATASTSAAGSGSAGASYGNGYGNTGSDGYGYSDGSGSASQGLLGGSAPGGSSGSGSATSGGS